MENGQPSQTALMAAAARAAHLIVDSEPLIFRDPLARPLLGARADELIDYHRRFGAHIVLSGARGQVTVRSRYTESRLAVSVRRGTSQYVILGAGLDSFACRSPLAASVRVFEVDHPATQEWKRDVFANAGIGIPSSLSLVPVDHERDRLVDCLAAAGFDRVQPAFVSWLGVTMYLSREAIGEVLAAVGGFAPGSELVLDHMLPARLRDEDGNAYADQVMPVAAERGEPWLTFLRPGDLAAEMSAHGLTPVEQVGQRDAIGPALWDRCDALRPIGLSMLARAAVAAR